MMKTNVCDWNMSDTCKSERRLDAVAWGLFFIWIGGALLARLSWGVGLIGVGVIILGSQAIRKYARLKAAGLWTAMGALFLLGGIWEWLNVPFSFTPVLCVIGGAALLVSVWIGKARNHKAGQNDTLPEIKKD